MRNKAEVFYWSDPVFLTNPERINRLKFWKHYKKVCNIYINGKAIKEGKVLQELETIFEALNLNPRCYIKEEDIKEVGHTSMSVGDIVKIGWKYYICMPVGWGELSFWGMKIKRLIGGM